MAAFQSPLDIWNRALDHAGGRAVTAAPPVDGSRNAAKCAEVYDKLRQAELRRNSWVFATRKAALRPIDVTTMQLVPLPYSAAIMYYVGDIVSYLGANWICLQLTPGAVAPVDGNGLVSPSWDNYYGPLTVDMWQAPQPGTVSIQYAYHAGELVYLAPGDGTFSAFLSLVDGNTDDPLGPDPWINGTMYNLGQIVLGSDGNLYQSQVNFNSGNNPIVTIPAAEWSSAISYTTGEYAFGSDNQIYQAVQGSLNQNPTADLTNTYWLGTGMWTATWTTGLTPQPRATSNNWHYVACSLQPVSIVFPVGAGPLSQKQSKNLYLLPSNFLMKAAEENQLGSRVSWLGAHDPPPDDYIFQGPFIISRRWGPIILRFISDFQNVALMDPLFCEGVAARMGWELTETLTQKPDLKAACLMAYTKVMGDARTINAIEVGPIAQVEDDYIRVRL